MEKVEAKDRADSTETLELSSTDDSGGLPLTANDDAASKESSETAKKVKKFLEDNKNIIRIVFKLIIHALIIIYFAFATKHFVTYTNSE